MQLYYGSLAWIVLVMERWWSALGASENHDAPTFNKSAPLSIQNYTAPLPLRSAHVLWWALLSFGRNSRLVSFLMGYVIALLVFNVFIKYLYWLHDHIIVLFTAILATK